MRLRSMSRSAVSDSDGSGISAGASSSSGTSTTATWLPVSVLTRSRRSLEASLASSALYGEGSRRYELR